MASKLILPCMVAIVSAIYWSGALAQSSCTNELIGLSPCLNYVTGNASTPSSSCCTQLASVHLLFFPNLFSTVSTQPRCLCLLLNGGASSIGITINQTRAMELPDACKVETPPVSRCNSANGQAPSSSPADSSNTPNTPSATDNTPAGGGVGGGVGGGSKTVPSSVDSSSVSYTKASSFKLVGFLLLIASYALSAPAV